MFLFVKENVLTLRFTTRPYLNTLTLKELGSNLWVYKNCSFTSVEELFCFGVVWELQALFDWLISPCGK
jgi:hypothetical protein